MELAENTREVRIGLPGFDTALSLSRRRVSASNPHQLLVIVIVFSYAIIAPIILPFGMIDFTGALIVYKKQLLYVYSPVYESGGKMFPLAVQRTLFGLVCGQLTFLGYLFYYLA